MDENTEVLSQDGQAYQAPPAGVTQEAPMEATAPAQETYGGSEVPAGTEGAISFLGEDGNVHYVIPNAQDNTTDTSTKEVSDTQIEQNIQKQAETEKVIADDLASKGVDFDAISKEYMDKGELSQASLDILEKAGYPKQVVDAYIYGMNAQVEAFVNNVVSYAGGEESWQSISQFLQGQDDATINAFNALVQTGSLSQVKMAVDGIKAKMTQQYGTANRSFMGGQTTNNITATFKNLNEVARAMSDPRYQTDEEYTQKLMSMLQNSNI